MIKETRENVALEFLGLENTERPAVIVPFHDVMQCGIGEDGVHLGRETGHVSGLSDGLEGVVVDVRGVIPIVEVWGGEELGSKYLTGGVELIGFLAPLGLLPLLLLGRFECEVILRPGIVELIHFAFGCGFRVVAVWSCGRHGCACGVALLVLSW